MISPVGGKAPYYRHKAETCRELAERADNPDTRANLLDAARQFDNLAEEAEAESR